MYMFFIKFLASEKSQNDISESTINKKIKTTRCKPRESVDRSPIFGLTPEFPIISEATALKCGET